MRLDFVEGSPENRDIRVLAVTTITMLAYANLIDAKQIRIMHPINKEVRDYYVSQGFTYNSADDYVYTMV